MNGADIVAIATTWDQWLTFWGNTHKITQDEFNQLPQSQREQMIRHKLAVIE